MKWIQRSIIRLSKLQYSTCEIHKNSDALELNFKHRWIDFINPLILVYLVLNPDLKLFLRICLTRNFSPQAFTCCDSTPKTEMAEFRFERTDFISAGSTCSGFSRLLIFRDDRYLVSDLGDEIHPLITQIKILLRLRAMADNFNEFSKPLERINYEISKGFPSITNHLSVIQAITEKLKSFLKLGNMEWKIQISGNKLNGVVWNTLRFPELEGIADPFLANEGEKHFVFFEGFKRKKEYGKIFRSRIDTALDGELLVDKPELIIDIGTHISFPYIFRSGGMWYLIPETSASKKVHIFAAEHLDGDWVNVLKMDFKFPILDPVIIEEAGRFRLIGSRKIIGDSSLSYLLQSFSSKSGISGPWIEDKGDYIWSSRNGRLGGVVEIDGEINLLTQSGCRSKYGHHLEISKISEIFLVNKRPDLFMLPKGNQRIHHFSSDSLYRTRDVFF